MIYLLTALPCEAKAVIDRYRLQGRAQHGAFRIYENDAIRLIIAGVGKLAAASAVAYLQSPEAKSRQHEPQAWLNIGISGHATRAPGEAVLGHKIIDAGSGRCWYPALIEPPACPTDAITTVDQVVEDYPEMTCYDMEASGFFAAASRFTSIELIHSLKVISDNRDSSCFNLTEEIVTDLIATHIGIIDTLIDQLHGFSAELASLSGDRIDISAYLERWHFTHYEQQRLQRLLQRWRLLFPEESAWNAATQYSQDSRSVLSGLQRRLDQAPVRFA